MSTPPTSDLDLFADEVLLDPLPFHAELRETAPVVHLPKTDAYALTRYDVIRDALADWESFSSTSIAFNPAANQALTGTSLASDPPVHTQLRATLTENLSPRALRGLKGRVEEKADALVADLVEQGTFEAVDALARAFPLQVVADLIGFTGHVRANMLRWGQAAMQVLGPMNRRTAESFPIAGELYAWCSQVKAEDLAEGSVGRGIFDAEARGAIPEGSAGHIIHQYLGAGVDTTIAAIGNVVALFAAHPEQFRRVRDEPALAAAAFNEVLRFWPPVNVWGRIATRDVEIEGVTVPKGAQIAVLLGAGNHDPRHYDDPDTFLIDRNPVDHLSFGYGPHGCAGQGLARLEAHAVIQALSRRVDRLVVGPEVRVPANITRSIDSLPVLEVIPA
ncbi:MULTISPECIES: cytochrome P450 [unclassified Streptomyces]|uniref:cytochrome P450 n=1 Tax=unclassified Streptomyces TaxID=2593676 RepID=UPI00202EB336|nr:MULTISPECIES: cytochrome P450 [unclassified Streptomyces]MCM1972435.1 cytochrome P450 [Streptomyces sp. G1]